MTRALPRDRRRAHSTALLHARACRTRHCSLTSPRPRLHRPLGKENQWGDSCWTYQRCRDGQFFAESWTQGKDYNFPEKNCCACGKDSVVETRQPASPYPGASAGGCQDHPNYVNQYGLDCAGYVRSGYCANGNVVQGQEWAMGADYGYPEKACACGRDRPRCVDNDK